MNICKKWGCGAGGCPAAQSAGGVGLRERRGEEEEGLGAARRSQCSQFPGQELHPGSVPWVSAPTFSRGLHQGTIPVTSIGSFSH